MKFNYGKIFLLGFGFFGVSVIWGVYNAFVPIFLANKFHLTPAFIGFFMTSTISPPYSSNHRSVHGLIDCAVPSGGGFRSFSLAHPSLH